MTYLVNPPKPIEVEVDGEHRPRHIQGDPHPGSPRNRGDGVRISWGGHFGPVRPVLGWIVDVDWWSQPVSREYWRVLLGEQLMCEIYRDQADGAWYLERVYD